MLDQETLRARALDRVLFEAAWKNERVANKFRGTIWLLAGIAMMIARPSPTPIVHFGWGVLVLILDATWMKRTFARWVPWLFTTVDLIVLVLGMHAGYAVAQEVDPLFAEHHLTGTAVGTLVVLGVNMMRFSRKLSIWSTAVAIACYAIIRIAHDRFDALTVVDFVLFASLCGMLVYTSHRFSSILSRVMLDLRTAQDARLASLTRLVAGVAHELNTPLGALKTNAQVGGRAGEVLKSAIPEPDKKVERALNALDQAQRAGSAAVERVSSIVESLKRFARLDQAEVQLADVRECLATCIELLPSDAKARIAVTATFSEVPRISCRPGHLNQAFMNLLENAVQAIDGEGKIEVRIAERDGQIAIAVEDTGRGIPKERLASIFDPTFASGGARTKMGFGLASSKSIVADHGGTIDIQSEVGRGTTVTVLLPKSE
jgi:signal transduction histidine kinase